MRLTKRQRKAIRTVSKIHIKNVIEISRSPQTIRETYGEQFTPQLVAEISTTTIQRYEKLIKDPVANIQALEREEVYTLRKIALIFYGRRVKDSVELQNLLNKLELLENIVECYN